MTSAADPVVRRPPALMVGAKHRRGRNLTVILLALSSAIALAYTSLATYIATKLVYEAPKPLVGTPADVGLSYRDVTFPSVIDHVRLSGWFLPGVMPGGRLTSERALVVIHGTRENRTDPPAHLLQLTAALVRQGFAVLSFDMRGMGQSPAAPLSLGYFEQRDVEGAVDYLRSGPIPYPELGRPRLIGGLGISMGAASLILAASQDLRIRAVVSDSCFADIIPLLEREIPRQGHLPSAFTPGALLIARVLYGVDYYAVRPVDVIGRLAPRPILLIHGQADTYVPPTDLDLLYAAASSAQGSNVTAWRVKGARHAQAFNVTSAAYITRVTAFFDAAFANG